MTIQEIATMPTAIDNVHESVYRSYHILKYVEALLARNTPPAVALQLLRELQGFEPIETRRLRLKESA